MEFVPNPNDYLEYNSFKAHPSLFQDNVFERFFIPTKTNLDIHSNINKTLSRIGNEYPEPLQGKNQLVIN